MLEIRTPTPDELPRALALVLTQPGVPPGQTRAQVEAFLACGLQSLPLSGQWIAVEDGSIVAAVVCLDLPGQTSLVFIPSMRFHRRRQAVVIDLLRRVISAGRHRGVLLYQVLVPPESEEDALVLGPAGFERLAELVYLERPSTLPVPPFREPGGITWTCYDQSVHPLFAEVIQATYEGSLDCPRLSGVRKIENILASHKAAGEFDPRRWFVVNFREHPVGCLLLARVPNRSALELVYMGLCPQARGQGLGKILLRRAVETALGAGLAYVTLAVDAGNTPACALYRWFGFYEATRRQTWILTQTEHD